jgi:AraC-like DNA-binding protein
MLDKEPYLDASLTLQKLASQLNMPSRELSILINQQIGKHFFDFVNEYRIKKAMEKLRNASLKKSTIQEIMYDVGFNSKTPFNTAFKKHTYLTPSQFRKSTDNKTFA